MGEYDSEPSGMAIGGAIFAGVMMIMIGAFQSIAGLAAIVEDDLFVVGKDYIFELDTTAWGWVHLILGVVIVTAGFTLFAGKVWAGTLAIVLAVLSAIANFFYIPHYPFWAILIIALDVWVIWALTRPGMFRET
ncbi:MAG TPA: hypothetical protein VLA22_07825 [Gaiellaceae bacterium]|nr:hypothetical protein [Gaiellaceae bacterium]